jgi:acetoin utilization protein AcuA
MAHPNQKCVDLRTRQGAIQICSFCNPADIVSLSLHGSISEYARYSPIITEKASLAQAASEPDNNVTLAYTTDGEIIGFAILQYPGADERWIRVGPQLMMEVAVVEVSRAWRSHGLATKLLQLVVDHPMIENRIFYMVGYSWTWDLEDGGLAVMDYRNMMIHLFSKFDFSIYQTNEPNILLRPENVFMARLGANLSVEVQRHFKMVLFNLDL